MNDLRRFLERYGSFLQANAVPQEVAAMPPRELHLELTYRCNTACVMCNLRYLEKKGEELTAEEIARMVEGSTLLRFISFVVLSGGEAWLREDLAVLVKYFKDRFPQGNILILSNLSDPALAVENLEKIKKEAGLDRVSVGSSLDGLGQAHDRMRGRAGSFEALKRSLETLREKYPEIFFSLNFTLTPDNVAQMLPVFNWCRENRYHISYQVMVQKKETRRFEWDAAQFETVEAQIDEIIARTCADAGITDSFESRLLANEGLLSLLLSYHYIPRYLKERKRYFPNCPCGEKYAMLDPSGNLYFCPVHKDRIAGSVRDRRFDELWLSGETGAIRRFFNEKKCHCWLTCTNGFMLGSAMASSRGKYPRRGP
ncbi:MAG: radical SAM protein [Endomicrobiales bacterium]